jgi:hypothetical protein
MAAQLPAGIGSAGGRCREISGDRLQLRDGRHFSTISK